MTARVVLEHGFEGPFSSGYYDATLPNGTKVRIHGKQASLISLILSGYVLRPDFHPFDAFDKGSINSGKVAKPDVAEASEG